MDRKEKKELETLIIDTVRSSGLISDFQKERTVGTPTDAYSITNRRFVTLNGNVADRPRSSVATVGQPYFAIDTFIPMVYSVGGWRDGVGSVVAGHR